jgi:transposase-like protein
MKWFSSGSEQEPEEDHQMADEMSMALEELLRKAQVSSDVDFLREGVRALAEALMELEVTRHVGAGRYDRTSQRTGERNGTRERRWDTRVGSITLQVPRVRDSSYFPRGRSETDSTLQGLRCWHRAGRQQ